MVEEKLLNIVQRLLDKTRAGETQWDKTAAKNSFQTAFPTYSVRISVSQSPEDPATEDYVISIFDEGGARIESASDGDLSKAAGVQGANAYTLMRDLYTLARRNALGVDQALDSLMAALESKSEERRQ